jgi:murein DD-endopeptidase MepM/ murein hydrolase activator NlpD
MFASALLAAACLMPPVDAAIVDPFREPACPWCPGNRGVTYRVERGATVRAAAGGTVTFSGVVADTRYVVVAHGDGLRATYGGLVSSTLDSGDRIAAGSIVGTSGAELHFGLRDGERYVDPGPLLGEVVHRARLVPTDGTAPRPAPPPRLRCAAGRA